MLTGMWPMLPPLNIGLVDVEDVAEAHLKGLITPGAADQRFITIEKVYKFTDIPQFLTKYRP